MGLPENERREAAQYRIAVTGAGYWGPNLVGNFRGSPDWDSVDFCDLEPCRVRQLSRPGSTVDDKTSVSTLVLRDDINGIAIATLEAGKHVLVEKPVADTPEVAVTKPRIAAQASRVLMVGHTFCDSPETERLTDNTLIPSLNNQTSASERAPVIDVLRTGSGAA